MTGFTNRSNSELSMDELYMRRCIEIAKNGLGQTAPNPMVGAVIVYDDRIIGEGCTSAYGGPHAEVNAIDSVKDKSPLYKSTLYVTLEPCSHYGKTPPCADLIIKHKIPKVVIGLKDPHEKVSGRGIQLLEEAGCEVTIGVLEKECREHHKRFLTFHEKKRPYIILKWAQTLDGFIAPTKEIRKENPAPFWITNEYSRQLVHKWRSEEQGILTGTNTVLEDNPKLDVRWWTGRHPIRIIIDRNQKIPMGFHVFEGISPTILFTSIKNSINKYKNIDLVNINENYNMALDMSKKLYELNIQSVFVEGGAKTIQSFINENLWDEARIFTGDIFFGDGLPAPLLEGRIIKEKQIQNDLLKILRNDQEHHL
ncbi:bifunctional diaminohydroxyphosphoribosylaminopyrimidine deaminase/5-amino-6-(5-phosphoribosylamino)uracil reductase RibD [Maribacter cobaltidurans]|nr:bifunctional diaminohydroxyphosphoribosylaminopyrimidine deaminase/5-amino-6-(5-phosphoribosylamino)uracil reductase RibD [Maribacter cobaltidurans]